MNIGGAVGEKSLYPSAMNDSPDEIPDRMNDSDHMLLRRFREGEQDAATQLFLKYSRRLQSLARSQTSETLASRFDPEDVVQSVFRTFFRRAANGLYDVPDGDELWQLLLVIALNKIRDLGTFHRAQKRDATRTDHVGDLGYLSERTRNKGDASFEVLRIVLEDFLENLPEAQAEVARMRMDGFQVNEIAEKTNRSKRTVERTLNSLRKQLLTKLDFVED